jgi:hypothetical protein
MPGLPGGSRERNAARISSIAVLAATDAVALIAALTAAYLLWASPVRRQSSLLYIELLPLVPLFILGYARSGLYPGFGLAPSRSCAGNPM